MSKPNRIIRVLLADDHPAMRAGIRAILESAPDIRVVGEANDGAEVKQLTVKLQPQVLLLDLRMPGPRPAEMMIWVRLYCPETAVLILTAHNLDAYLSAVVTAGAAGFVIKEEAPETIIGAVRRAARGEILFSREQLTRARRWQREVGARWESLANRERQVLGLLTKGMDNAAMATALHVTTRTVEQHVTSILRKLDVASRLEAVVWVRENHLEDL